MSIAEKIAELRKKKIALGKRSAASQSVEELRGISNQLEGLNEEITLLEEELEEEQRSIAGGNTPPNNQRGGQAFDYVGLHGQVRSAGSYPVGGAGREGRGTMLSKEQLEERGNKLKNRQAVEFGIHEMPELRAVTIGSGDLVVPNHASSTLNQGFNEVSSVIDVVNAVPLEGGEAYKKGFIIEYGEGDYTTESGDYEDADPKTDYVDINKAKITAYSELTDEAAKLPSVNYQEMVKNGMQVALRKKIARQIVAGLGGANQIRGIFNAPTNVIPTESDLSISEIDETTLDKIVFGYGGSENVEGGAYLFLNKIDLAAFAAIRATDGKKLYTIKIDENGNTGTISSDNSYAVRYIINSICPALSNSGTAADTYCMAYGKPAAYEMPIFSPVTVEESRDFKFKSGQICYRGSVWVGGNVAAYKGFVRIKKVAAPEED